MGKYNTEQKKLIKDYLIENKSKFVSVSDIVKYMKKNNQQIGETTIYRFLNSLEKLEEVRTEVKEHTKYYQYISNECNHHFHLKCKKCGEIVHLHCEDFENVSNHIKDEHKFQIDHNTIIYGICGKCANK